MRADFHMHSNRSFDAWTSPKSMVALALKAGLGAIALTDHGKFEGCAKVQAQIAAQGAPLILINGMEIDTEYGEVLALFLSERVKSVMFAEVCDEIHSQGGFLVIPHPFDFLRGHACNPEKLPANLLSQVDGIEAFNARCTLPSSNKRAADFALSHKIKLTTAGSDAHFPFEIGGAYGEIPDGTDPAIAMRRGLITPCGKQAFPLVHGPTTLLKLARKAGLFLPKE